MNISKNIIVGAGLTGTTLAYKIATELDEKVLVIDKRPHIAGNCYDEFDSEGLYLKKYGPHIFHTNDKKVWDFLSQFTNWHPFFLKTEAFIDGNLVNIPFNFDSIEKCFPKTLATRLEEKLLEKYEYNSRISISQLLEQDDKDLKFLANYIYENVFKNYTEKQWGIKAEKVDKSVLTRVPILISRDKRYFQDRYQAIPQYGYTAMIEKMLDHPNIELILNTKFDKKTHKAERLIFTGCIDEFFDYKYGKLPYRSLAFKFQKFDKEFCKDTSIVNYPNEYDFTRITEFKHFLDLKSEKTIIATEYPQHYEPGKNEPYYPIANKENHDLLAKYQTEAKNIDGLIIAGRLGEYKYYNIDAAVARALELFDKEVLNEFFKEKNNFGYSCR
ncbi:MAG: UDP-galactopyranose mutase [Candidatus Melainabacteria bacterium GWF2_37_15]|nr:MAG: UDP-galactopyranose mutase [Candidatus Melainabacteria bacterium GWF2_37_15]